MNIRHKVSLVLFLISAFGGKLLAQIAIPKEFALVETAQHIKEPAEIRTVVDSLHDSDSLVITTFSKATGGIIEYKKITKATLLSDLAMTGFRERYFMIIVGANAIFYLNP